MLASRIRIVPVGATAFLLTGASESRVGILITPPITGSVTLSNDPDPVSGQGFNLNPGGGPHILHLHDHGDVVQREWYIIGSGAGLGVGVIEVLATCEKDQLKHLGRVLGKTTALYPEEVGSHHYGT